MLGLTKKTFGFRLAVGREFILFYFLFYFFVGMMGSKEFYFISSWEGWVGSFFFLFCFFFLWQ